MAEPQLKTKEVLWDWYTSLASKINRPSSQSTFLTTGSITPQEFVEAGDLLVHKCGSWSWYVRRPSGLFLLLMYFLNLLGFVCPCINFWLTGKRDLTPLYVNKRASHALFRLGLLAMLQKELPSFRLTNSFLSPEMVRLLYQSVETHFSVPRTSVTIFSLSIEHNFCSFIQAIILSYHVSNLTPSPPSGRARSTLQSRNERTN